MEFAPKNLSKQILAKHKLALCVLRGSARRCLLMGHSFAGILCPPPLLNRLDPDSQLYDCLVSPSPALGQGGDLWLPCLLSFFRILM
ncbi:rCG40790 [Rattus norvegicus]|uniref:RCG40790 n=1 Tax=Rattus norvegicus TaxID=10116 RepID=A6KNY9_RAT|nr:rCG40790 [Rattus norvegicus]